VRCAQVGELAALRASREFAGALAGGDGRHSATIAGQQVRVRCAQVGELAALRASREFAGALDGGDERHSATLASVVSLKFVAEVEPPKCRSFDSFRRKNAPKFAQDDHSFVMRTSDSGH